MTKGAKFCGNCGEEIMSLETPTTTCSACGYVATDDEKYCPECGNALQFNSSTNRNQQPISPTQKVDRAEVKKGAVGVVKTKKSGILRTLGKVTLWISGVLIIATTIFYLIGDNISDAEKSSHDQQVQNQLDAYEENKKVLDISDENSADKYRYGIDVTSDQYEAFERYKVFAENGDLNAMISLSEYYEQGIWVKKDRKKAKGLLEKAAKAGSLEAEWQLEYLESIGQ
jgi:ribosomal protein S27AE